MKANIVKDSKFGFKRVEPIPTQEEVEKFYAQEFYDANAKYFNNSALLLQEEQSDFLIQDGKQFMMKWSLFLVTKFQISLFLILDLALHKPSNI